MNIQYAWILLTISFLWNVTDSYAQKTPDSVLGAPVKIKTFDNETLKGEMISVAGDTLWILAEKEFVPYRLDDLRQIDIYRNKLTGRKFFIRSMIGGIASAAVMTAACESVSDGCGGVFVSITAIWAAVTGGAAYGVDKVSRLRVTPPYNAERMNLHSRFPQGIPPGTADRIKQ